MEEIGLKEGIALVKKYNKMLPKEREMLQKQRFFAALFHAREHSELYRELYKNLGVNFFMRDVPMMNRDIALAHKDMWRSDEEVLMEIDVILNVVQKVLRYQYLIVLHVLKTNKNVLNVWMDMN